MHENGDPNMAAVLIKMFLRELPEPLLTFNSYKTVVGIRGEVQFDSREIQETQ